MLRVPGGEERPRHSPTRLQLTETTAAPLLRTPRRRSVVFRSRELHLEKQPKFQNGYGTPELGAGGYLERAPYDPTTQRAFRDRRRVERRGGCRFQVSI